MDEQCRVCLLWCRTAVIAILRHAVIAQYEQYGWHIRPLVHPRHHLRYDAVQLRQLLCHRRMRRIVAMADMVHTQEVCNGNTALRCVIIVFDATAVECWQ